MNCPDPSGDPVWLYAFMALLGAAFLGFAVGYFSARATQPIK
jgi:hypothetical protein